jgi:hypothetical protein
MDQQQITPEDGGAYVVRIPSGRKLRDAPAFFLRGNWHFVDDAGGDRMSPARLVNFVIRRKIEGARIEPAGLEARLGGWVKPDYLENGGDNGLENGANYIVEFSFTGGPHGDVERMIVQYEDGVWLSFSDGDGAFADGPIPVEGADYRVIRKVDLWAA